MRVNECIGTSPLCNSKIAYKFTCQWRTIQHWLIPQHVSKYDIWDTCISVLTLDLVYCSYPDLSQNFFPGEGVGWIWLTFIPTLCLTQFFMTAYHLTTHIFLNVLKYVQQNIMEHFNLCVWMASLNIILTLKKSFQIHVIYTEYIFFNKNTKQYTKYRKFVYCIFIIFLNTHTGNNNFIGIFPFQVHAEELTHFYHLIC